ncbi:hypothetical protein [Actinomadura sp. 9N407]|uniref:hypothetical protein n=1 Tax=Actinomadura sp. 9N407 TaxID=3375154 RepID=UPI0037929115
MKTVAIGRVALWHGDVTHPARQRILRDPPDLLLTTPESIEAMLVRTKVDVRPDGKGALVRHGGDRHRLRLDPRLREVLLGADPAVALTDRAVRHLTEARERNTGTVHPGARSSPVTATQTSAGGPGPDSAPTPS